MTGLGGDLYLQGQNEAFLLAGVGRGRLAAKACDEVAPREGSLDTKSSMNDRRPETAPVKKPYKTPALRFENVFEVSALSCGKLTTTSQNCKTGGTKNS